MDLLMGIPYTLPEMNRQHEVVQERERFEKVQRSLDDRVAKGVVKQVWVVETPIGGLHLPQYTHSVLGNIRNIASKVHSLFSEDTEPRMFHGETVIDYFKRIFDPNPSQLSNDGVRYYTAPRDGLLVIGIGGHYLAFEKKVDRTEEKMEEATFFEPRFPENWDCILKAETLVRRVFSNLRFSRYDTDIYEIGHEIGLRGSLMMFDPPKGREIKYVPKGF